MAGSSKFVGGGSLRGWDLLPPTVGWVDAQLKTYFFGFGSPGFRALYFPGLPSRQEYFLYFNAKKGWCVFSIILGMQKKCFLVKGPRH